MFFCTRVFSFHVLTFLIVFLVRAHGIFEYQLSSVSGLRNMLPTHLFHLQIIEERGNCISRRRFCIARSKTSKYIWERGVNENFSPTEFEPIRGALLSSDGHN